jgi:hypothetical protein
MVWSCCLRDCRDVEDMVRFACAHDGSVPGHADDPSHVAVAMAMLETFTGVQVAAAHVEQSLQQRHLVEV